MGINKEQLGISVELIKDKLDDINIAQKTVNSRGIKELLPSELKFTIRPATTEGTGLPTDIAKTVTLQESILKYNIINIQIAIKSASVTTLSELNTFSVSTIVLNNSETAKADGSLLYLFLNISSSGRPGHGGIHLGLIGWFKDETHFYISRAINPIMDAGFDTMTLTSIQGVNVENVTIDPVQYVNTTQGIEDVPVGNIITVAGDIAPKHYLLYDDTEYNITDYPYIAQYIKDQFGSFDYFGGDGINTFCVSDIHVSQDPIDVTPIMTSNTAPAPYVVSASSYWTADGGYSPYKAFDNDNNKVTSGHNWITADGTKTGWIKLDFNKKTAISHFSLQCHTSINSSTTAHMPKDFVLFGSDDDIVYNKIKEFYGETDWVFNEKRIFELNGSFVYRYYKLEIIDNNGYSRYSTIPELRFLHKSTENKYIKYEPTYFMNIQGLVEENILFEGKVGTDSVDSITSNINLSDSIINYDSIKFYFYNVYNVNACHFDCKEIPVDELKLFIDSKSTTSFISLLFGFLQSTAYTNITTSSTYERLNVIQNQSYVTKITGIKYKTFPGQGGTDL